MTTFDTLATDYDAGRIGYSNEIYDTLITYGVRPGDRIVDVCCGTGLASRPLIENQFPVTGIDVSQPMLDIARSRFPDATWVSGPAETLPFAAGSFDAAISAQAFHHVDRRRAMDEITRVLRPGGIVAIWWKKMIAEDPVHVIRQDLVRELGSEPPVEGLTGGFREFYGTPLVDHSLRVIPWRTTMRLDQYMTYERSRKIIRDALGDRAGEYFNQLEERLRARFGDGNPLLPLSYTHFLYLGKKA